MLIRLFLVFVMLGSGQAFAESNLWRLLEKGGQVMVMRHTSTESGIGDPPGFRLGDCATQRNLSEAGRIEAREVGAAFARRGIILERVLSSEWCRCLETAELAFGKTQPWEPANSFFDNPSERLARTEAMRQRVADFRGPSNLMIVTHQVNIQALAGVNTAMSEIVVLTPDLNGGFKFAGKLRLN